MYSWIARPFVRRAYGHLNRADVEAVVAAFRDDGMFSFPGAHELAGVYRGRDELRQFFGRLFEWFPGLTFELDDLAVSGPPWRMRLWVRYHDSAARSGVSWLGHGTQYAQLRWGRLRTDYIANDTQAVADYLDRVRTVYDVPSRQSG